MQENRSNIGLGLVILLIGVVIFFLFRDNKKISWWEHYRGDSKDPYGTLVIQNLLENYFENQSFQILQDSLFGVLPTDSTGLNYIFIGEATYLDSVDNQRLMEFVEIGNKAFISSKTIPFELFDELYYEDCEEVSWEDYYTYYDSIVHLDFIHSDLMIDTGYLFKYFKYGEIEEYEWAYLNYDIFCEENVDFVELGDIDDNWSNFAKVKYGEGEFYFHTTPIAFTNFSLLEESNLEYAHKVFSHLTDGKIYWDEFSRVPEGVGRRRNQSDYRSFDKESPLKYVLSQPPLAWAWYLMLGTTLLYVIFRAKRRQRIIPVLEQNTNTSLEFISTIGRLYFIQNNHRKLALQKMKLFLGYVRDRYKMPTKELNEQFVNQLVAKSEIPKKAIDKILLVYRNIENSKFVSENTLVDFHREMEKFYKNCK